MFYVIEQNNDLLVLKQWKCALNYPTLRARSVSFCKGFEDQADYSIHVYRITAG